MASDALDAQRLPKLSALLQDYLVDFSPGDTVGSFLKASADPECLAPALEEMVKSNQLYRHYLHRIDILQGKIGIWNEEDPKDHSKADKAVRILRFLGRAAVRNALVCIRLNRTVEGVLPRKENDKFLISPGKTIKYALLAQEYCESNGLAHAEIAYQAGLHYDWLATLMERKGKAAKAEKPYLEEIWATSLGYARIAYELGAIPKNFSLGKYAFSGALLAQLGKVMMALSFPQGESLTPWKDFAKKCAKAKEHEDLALLIGEKSQYPFNHAEMSSFCIQFFGVLKEIEKAIWAYREPFLIKQKESDLFVLAVVIHSAIALAQAKKYPKKKPEDPPLNSEQLSLLQSIGISPSHVNDIISQKS